MPESPQMRRGLVLAALVVFVLVGSDGLKRGYCDEETKDDAGAHYNLGIVYARQGKYAEGIKELTRAIELNPDHAQAKNQLMTTEGWIGMLGG